MNVVIVCTNCKKPLRIGAEALGKKVRCPACKTVFVGQRDEFRPKPAATPTAPKPADVPPPPANDALFSEEDVTPSA